MLSISTLKSAASAATYFEKDDYYFASIETAPSLWWGVGAEKLGLSGPVDRETFARLLEGELPNGVTLPKKQGKDHRPGIDLTFSAPKSVSLLALVGGNARVLRAHERAVTEALSYLEKEAAAARMTTNGITMTVKTENLLVARFNHDTSRALDPQLHTHAVVLNATDRDGAWRALTNEALYEHKIVAGLVYRAELARELVKLGYAVERTHADGRFEVKGFTDEQLRGFSKRRDAIEAALEAEGRSGPEASAEAALRTRIAKKEVDRGALRALWKKEAKALGIRLPRPDHGHCVDEGKERARADRAVNHAIAHLAERAAVFSEREIFAQALKASVGRSRPMFVHQEIQRRFEAGALQDAEPLRRARHELGRFATTKDAIATEAALLKATLTSPECAAPILDRPRIEASLNLTQLTDGQKNAVRLALGSRFQIVGVQGYAGTGKTTALKMVAELAESAGYAVRGLAPSATAAKLLRDEAGMESQTIASFLLELKRAASAPNGKLLWVVDELSMVGNKNALEIVEAANRLGARVILMGDKEQLPSIEAGRAFALLSDRGLPLTSMSEIVRQKNPQILNAVRATIAHDQRRALRHLDGQITSIPERAERLSAIAKAYLDVPANERSQTLVITASNKDRAELNLRIRNGLKNEGVLRGPDFRTTVLVSRTFTEAEKRESTAYVVGDQIRFGRTYKTLGVEEGDVLTIKRIDENTNTIVLDDGRRTIAWEPHKHAKAEVYESGRRDVAEGDVIRWTRNDKTLDRRNGERAVVLNISPDGHSARIKVGDAVQSLDLVRERHWDHAYATTVHAAQGKTADRVLLHIDTTQNALVSHESFYVGLSRARQEVKVFTNDARALPEAVSRSLGQPSALESLRIVARRL